MQLRFIQDSELIYNLIIPTKKITVLKNRGKSVFVPNDEIDKFQQNQSNRSNNVGMKNSLYSST